VESLPFDDRAADRAAKVRFELASRGAEIGSLDILIAGTVLSRGATLVTHNSK
jgi:predicted nucleic acid-binding protein